MTNKRLQYAATNKMIRSLQKPTYGLNCTQSVQMHTVQKS